MFELFEDESLQYYIIESTVDAEGEYRELATKSDMLIPHAADEGGTAGAADRFGILNDILLSISLKDDITAQQLTSEYLCKDFCARELFRVL
jgi:hypothetical protein